MAAPAIQTSSESGSSNVFTKPTGLADNDVLYILYWQFHSLDVAPIAPTGFAEPAGAGIPYTGVQSLEARIYRKVIVTASGEPANYTVTRGTGTNHADGGEIFRVSGVNTTTPENTVVSNEGTSTTASSGTFSTTVADCLLFAAIVDDSNAVGAVTGMTEAYNQDGGDSKGFFQTLSGTVSSVTRDSALGGSKPWVVALVAVAPPGAATKAPPPSVPAYALQALLGR